MKVPKRENKAVLICPHCSKNIVNIEQLEKVMKTILKAQTELHKKEKEAIFKELDYILMVNNNILLKTYEHYIEFKKKWFGETR